jgi:GNAT superfamily N-acetyltransferase
MSVEPVVRPASVADAEICRTIDAAARVGLADQRGGAAWLAEHPALVGDDWLAATLVVTIEDAVVGFLIGRRAAHRGRGDVYSVDRVYVVEEARELGCGDALIAAAMDVARGCEFFEAVALPGDRETKNLYERAGVTARSIVVSKALETRT